jgi:ricin-type beta-trefoil lectin protein
VSNLAPPATVACPAQIKDGQLWLDASGVVTYAPAGSAVALSGTVQGCVAPAAKTFTLTAAVTGTWLPSSTGFRIDDATLTVDGDLGAKSFTVKAVAHVTVTAVGDAAPFTVGISFGSDGSFVAGASVPDLGKLGLAGTNGWLLIANKKVAGFKPSDLGIPAATDTSFDLPAGVTVTMAFSLTDAEVTALRDLHVPLNGAAVQLEATLSTSSFAVKIEVNFGSGDQGLVLIDTASGIKLILDTFYVDFNVNAASTTLSLGGTAYLQVPSVVPGISAPNHIEVGITGSINVETLTFSVGVSLAGACGTATCTWPDAFGIKGLNVDSLAGNIGIDFETAVPTPTIALKVSNLVLPDSWASAIGMMAGATVTLALDVNLSQPLVDIEIDPGPDSTVALTPLKMFSVNADVIKSLQVHKAHLLFAPTGGVEADGTVVNPGVNLDFSALIGGVMVDIAGAVNLSPTDPSITADVNVDSFNVGTVSLTAPTLHLAISPTAADFSFAGGFTDTSSGTSFSGKVDLGASTSLLGASVALNITGGLPGYLYAAGSLNGSVRLDSTGLDMAVSGSLYLSISGYFFSAINVSYSATDATIWRDLNNDAAAVAAAFISAYNWNVGQIQGALSRMGFSVAQIEQAIASAFNQGLTFVIQQLSNAGVPLDALIQGAISGLNATQNQIAAALHAQGLDYDTVASELESHFSDGSAALFDALVSIGDPGSSVVSTLSGLFDNGSYNLWVGDAPEVMDVSNSSQDIGGSVIQYTLDFGTNQDWYVLPTDSGYAELVNRNSGQCLTDINGATGKAALVQFPCVGNTSQQWYLGVYPGNSNLSGQSRVMTNRFSRLVAEVEGASILPGAIVEQYGYNAGSNQTWTFLPAA